MMHQLSASLFVFRLNRILDRRTRGAPFIAAGGEETEGCSSGIRADNLVFPGINWCSRLVNGRKGEKRVVETERRVPARNWSGSRGSSSDFTGPSLSLERREEESSGGFEVEESRVSKPGKWILAWAEKLGTRRSRGQQLIAVACRLGRESGRIENEMWAESMVGKWPIFQVRREGGRGSFVGVSFSLGILEKKKKKKETRDWSSSSRRKIGRYVVLAGGNDERLGVERRHRVLRLGGGCLQTRIIMFVTRILVEVVAIGRNNGNGERARWSSLYHLTDAADTYWARVSEVNAEIMRRLARLPSFHRPKTQMSGPSTVCTPTRADI